MIENEGFMFQGLDTFLLQSGFSSSLIEMTHLFISLSLLAFIAFLVYWVFQKYIVRILEKIAHKSTFQWDDIFIRNLFF